ncbi:hypothetical protein MVEN_02220200 [Mycena venus]|uniref:Uncharacterized protein n=1 Tax=Mycena venus TaxID=2733690 RepID=A0A8H7CH07_9AGAR|nr:hypothetical protein MVEN_02220200 [Mycena venus]
MFCTPGRLLRATLALILVSPLVYSQTPTGTTRLYDPSPFNLIGTISAMTCNETDGPLAGGSITVDGMVITVPKNLLVTLPSISVAWPELFDGETPSLPLLGSVSWEATVFGNIVQGQPIAGIIYIVQESTQLLQGFITQIDYTTGHFFINGEIEAVLNDPLGQYGPVYTDYPLWTVDAQNPSITASTGFPLCIPRNSTDADCPLTNRPVDGDGFYLTTLQVTFGNPATLAPGAPDPRLMVPLVVGDYITFSGTKVPGGLLAIYSLSANLGIYTAPGTQPAYISPATATYAIQVADATLEAGETRATAFVTDPTIPVEWYAIDVDPCTGDETERDLLLVVPASAAPAGKTTFHDGIFLHAKVVAEVEAGGGGGGVTVDTGAPTREVGFRYSSGTSAGPKGLIAGQYIQPIFFFVFPELISFGANEVPNQFDMIPFLAMGSGPYEPGNYLAAPLETPTRIGQLSPWPGDILPGTTACAPLTTATASA